MSKRPINYKLSDFLSDLDFQAFVLKNENSEYWNKFISSNPQNLSILDNAQEIIKEMDLTYKGLAKSDLEIDHRWQDFKEQSDLLPIQRKKTTIKRLSIHHLVKISACFILLSGLISISYYLINNNSSSISNSIVYSTLSAETEKFLLADSTIVVLNGNSKLEVNENFSISGSRTVKLEGQGYFEVRKAESPENQFIILANNSKVTVLGTKFDLINTSSGLELSLEEGLVNLEYNDHKQKNKNVNVQPGESVIIDKKGKLTLKTHKNNKVNSTWKTGFFEYESHPLSKVISDVERQFKVTFENKSAELLTTKISGVIPTTNLKEALTVLEILIGKKLEFNNASIITIH